MAADVVFVIDRRGYESAFKSWTGAPLGSWMNKKTELARVAAGIEAPGPGKVPRNRTMTNYGKGILEKSMIATRHHDSPSRDLESHITALPKYAKFVHEGTRGPYVIRPKKPGGVLRFRSRAGHIVFARFVIHPGIKSNPYLFRALKRVMPGV